MKYFKGGFGNSKRKIDLLLVTRKSGEKGLVDISMQTIIPIIYSDIETFSFKPELYQANYDVLVCSRNVGNKTVLDLYNNEGVLLVKDCHKIEIAEQQSIYKYTMDESINQLKDATYSLTHAAFDVKNIYISKWMNMADIKIKESELRLNESDLDCVYDYSGKSKFSLLENTRYSIFKAQKKSSTYPQTVLVEFLIPIECITDLNRLVDEYWPDNEIVPFFEEGIF